MAAPIQSGDRALARGARYERGRGVGVRAEWSRGGGGEQGGRSGRGVLRQGRPVRQYAARQRAGAPVLSRRGPEARRRRRAECRRRLRNDVRGEPAGIQVSLRDSLGALAVSAAPADWLPFLTELADRADEIALRFFRVRGLRVA